MKISKQYIHNSDGSVDIIDDRIFNDCISHQLNYIRETAKEQIIFIAPEYKQRNAALGLLSQEETQQIKDNIQTIREKSNIKEQQILSIVWDGTEETRSAACDAVQSICW
jgi:hypothetical protein